MNASDDTAAVVGLACRFPGGADTPAAFWSLLEKGVDAVGPMPEGRFDVRRFLHPEPGTPGKLVTDEGGFLAGIDLFDAAFFGISPREARKIDPQHRLLLEVSWEAFEDAGIPPSSVAAKRVGVYVGLWTGEYENVMYRDPEALDFHALTGGGRYSASGRLSFALDLRGPCMTVDTGCSSGLVALHLARQALETGEVDLALVGAANLILQPHVNIGYSRSGMLSVGGRCRFGDASGTGYVRSEGAAAVVLKPLGTARMDRDRVRGLVLATGVNADGQGSGQLATPSAEAQADLLRFTYGRAGVDPRSVPYVEAHGTGTRAGDPVEVGALGSVLGADRPASEPLLLGSVKTNIGHTEACAGLAGLFKALLALEHRTIPGSLHLVEPNPDIAWEELGVRIPTETTPWPAGAAEIAGVSSFGITGTNAHAIVAGPDPRPDRAGATRASPRLINLSARGVEALRETVGVFREEMGTNGASLIDLSYTTTARREHHSHRVSLVADSIESTRQALDSWLDAGAAPFLSEGVVESGRRPRLAFVFSGQGSQWVGMGRELLEVAPRFAETIGACDAALAKVVDWSLLSVLRGDGDVLLDRIDVIQPSLAAVQIALARQLEAWGLVPDAVVGHSMGEAAAAHVAGALGLDDAMLVLAARSRLLAEIAGRGAMALVDLDQAAVDARLSALGGGASVAAVNGPRSTIVSGDPGTVDRLLQELETEEVFCRRVRVDVASHSPQCDPLLPRLGKDLAGVAPRRSSAAFYSTVLARATEGDTLGADYWVTNLRQPVRFDEAVRTMLADGLDLFVEIAPHPILLSSLADVAAAVDRRAAAVPLLRREEPEQVRLLEAVGRLHVLGAPVRWNALADPDAAPVEIPPYRWQRERHWLDRWEDWSENGSGIGKAVTPRPEEADRHVYEPAWRVAATRGAGAADLTGPWLILDDEAGVGRLLGAALEGAGGRVLTAPYDPRLARPGAGTPPEAARLVEEALSLDGEAPLRIVNLWSADARAGGGIGTMEEALARSCGTTLSLIKAVQAAGPRVRAIWWVTRGAQAPGDRTPVPEAAAQGALWGLVRTLWRERPELSANLVDLDPTSSNGDVVGHLLSALEGLAHEAQVAFARGVPHVARLAPASREATSTPAGWRADGAYLVTGGLGEVGLTIAAEMVRGGARRLILAGRTPLPPRDRWAALPDGDVSRKTRGIRSLEAMGASVHTLSVDVSDEGALADALARYAAEGWPSIVGAVHCAASLEDGLLGDLDWRRFMAAASGKAVGAWNLHTLLPDLERMVLFSSVFSVAPQVAHGNYAAANAFLEHLAAARSGASSPTVSLGWGVWKGTGLSMSDQVAWSDDVLGGGLGGFSSEVATSLFAWCAAAPRPNLVVAPVHWSSVARTVTPAAEAFYAEAIGTKTEDAEGSRDLFAERLLSLPEHDRPRAMADRLREMVARILELELHQIADHHPLGRRGLDSLMAMELRRRLERDLGLELPASVVWNHPTIATLSEHLLGRLSDGHEGGSEAQRGPAPVGAPAPGAGLVAEVIAEVAAQTEADALRELRGGRT